MSMHHSGERRAAGMRSHVTQRKPMSLRRDARPVLSLAGRLLNSLLTRAL